MPESRLTQQQRQFIKKRANGCCEYCLSQAKFSPDPFSIEHIIPRSKGGTIDTPRAEAAGILKTIISVLKALTKCLY